MNDLRKKVKLLKALQGIPYKEIAEYLEISTTTIYSWLNGQFEFGEAKEQQLREIIDLLKEQENENA